VIRRLQYTCIQYILVTYPLGTQQQAFGENVLFAVDCLETCIQAFVMCVVGEPEDACGCVIRPCTAGSDRPNSPLGLYISQMYDSDYSTMTLFASNKIVRRHPAFSFTPTPRGDASNAWVAIVGFVRFGVFLFGCRIHRESRRLQKLCKKGSCPCHLGHRTISSAPNVT
jgi:hypothetical protein